ncbi:hypothetical protein A2303_02450 [Candidatus Falkowbacteria bacterium RIFOXYB2_FULL_47_14]|uniref:Uncharacterized protein n=1 Tax=Candidatus Falkowbacteria bacterium RIFOXYA2_FULL_47_19 TaxID=1797994 RepID=A0A1F5SFW3_9BACT|nr:MAG: hypothetical protein A2227_07630 [Candidatus Falkowbacteria bacterium RIFOXYA2_FULL_47_19]OGF35941.1 MAG: hypothetical protein A2468_01875 [Candidatus Falkowbacteria bacterium RIFOXYC2_FULL_46_15]OGF43921.1 MAG: hypothetical protein A2303_02450 [Candidatus Falkowbacteria bacterium RIFOXYB2_FULL_47_14]
MQNTFKIETNNLSSQKTPLKIKLFIFLVSSFIINLILFISSAKHPLIVFRYEMFKTLIILCFVPAFVPALIASAIKAKNKKTQIVLQIIIILLFSIFYFLLFKIIG